MRTAGVKKLVGMALDNLPKPYTEHVIDEAFQEIENSPELMVEYEGLCKQLGKTTVNTWGGYWIANALGKTGLEQVPAKKNKLIQTYSRLTESATAPGKKRKASPKEIGCMTVSSSLVKSDTLLAVSCSGAGVRVAVTMTVSEALATCSFTIAAEDDGCTSVRATANPGASTSTRSGVEFSRLKVAMPSPELIRT